MPSATSVHLDRGNAALIRIGLAIVPVLLLALATACTAPQGASSGVATSTATLACDQQETAPQITEIRPAQPMAGSEISVTGSGGFVKDTCGGISEGSRSFKLYLDDEAVGDLSCYVNHCEEEFTLPGNISAGPHCLSVKTGECQFEFQILN